jgi:uncharacterized membrane protein YraQ (UPF0718 family)
MNHLIDKIYLIINWNDLQYRFLQSHTFRVLEQVYALLLQLLPYLLLSILLSTVIKHFTTVETLKRFLSGKNVYVSIVVAALLGIVSPLGSYIVLPLSAALLLAGLPLAPMVTFMVSSPLINPGLFMLTVGALGMEMAVMRVVSAFLLGVVAGLLTEHLLQPMDVAVNEQAVRSGVFIKKRSLPQEALAYTKYISKYFFIGIFIAALTKVFIPVAWLTSILGSNHVLSIFAATLAGVPFYTCGGAELPVIQQLADFGADKGAILAYFISGPATKVATVVLIVSVFKKQIVYLYFAISIVGAILMGLLYHYML